MNITLVSPFHGGSHAAWAEGYAAASEHEVTLLTLPDRHWKWRMHGGAITLARRFREEAYAPELILATDMLDLTTFLALTRDRTAHISVALYMHENQLTYPWPGAVNGQPTAEQDRHYAFINYTSMLAADAVLFNSQYHHDAFFEALPEFLKPFPDHNEPQSRDRLRSKSHILPVGIDLTRLNTGEHSHLLPALRTQDSGLSTPLILWNQRWEYDKNPELFFGVLYQLADAGVPFRLALCGERYSRWPAIFNDAQEHLHDRIIHAGYATPDRYRELLWNAAITVSTAHHEFFGISAIEAIYCHTLPLLPRRLSYPELIPELFHDACLYHDRADLVKRLAYALKHPIATAKRAAELASSVERFDWRHVAPLYDRLFENMSTARCGKGSE